MFKQGASITTAATHRIKQKNYGLDIARCCAIVLVFSSHSLLNLYSAKIPYLWYLVFTGVELFFSLSGFLIGRMLIELFEKHQTELSFRHISNFWIRRWFRTLPLYFSLLCIYFIIYNFFLYPVDFDWKYLFFLQSMFNPPPGFMGESWSLAIEEWFYFVFPALLFLAYLLRKSLTSSGRVEKIFVPLVLMIIGIQIVIRLFNPGCSSWGCISVSLHFDAAAYGLIGAYFSKFRNALNKKSAFFVMITGIVLCLLAAVIKIKVPGYTYLAQLYFPVNGTGTTLIILGLYYSTFSWKPKAIPYISKISYSIYLVHLSGVIIPLQHFTRNTNWEGTFLIWMAGLLLTMIISSITYRLIEKPFLLIRDRKFPAA